MKEYLMGLLLVRLPNTLYTHWMRYPSKARTLSTPVMVAVCSVRAWTVYTAPGKAVPRASPLSNVPLCIHSGAVPVSLCLQMRVSWSEQCPWSSSDTLKLATCTRGRFNRKHPLTYLQMLWPAHPQTWSGLRRTQRLLSEVHNYVCCKLLRYNNSSFVIPPPDCTLYTTLNHLITNWKFNAVSNVCHKSLHDTHMGKGKLWNSIYRFQ